MESLQEIIHSTSKLLSAFTVRERKKRQTANEKTE